MAAEQKARRRAAAHRRTSRAARRTCTRSSRTTSGSTPTRRTSRAPTTRSTTRSPSAAAWSTDLEDDDAQPAALAPAASPPGLAAPASAPPHASREEARARPRRVPRPLEGEGARARRLSERLLRDGRRHDDRRCASSRSRPAWATPAGDTLLERVERLVAGDGARPRYQPDDEGRLRGRHRRTPRPRRTRSSARRRGRPASRSSLIVAGVVWFFRSVVVARRHRAARRCSASARPTRSRTSASGTSTRPGMFLGAIILGNGINYPIVLLSRYREFRARGQEPRRTRGARRCRTRSARSSSGRAWRRSRTARSPSRDFRGFNQFGWIGFVGMLLVWVSMIPCVPALLVVIEWIQSKLPAGCATRRRASGRTGAAGRSRAPSRGRPSARRWVFLAAAAATHGARGVEDARLPARPVGVRLRPPRLAREQAAAGRGEWSNKAEQVFGGKMNVAGALMLADTPEQVPLLKAQILANDDGGPAGRASSPTWRPSYDLLPGNARGAEGEARGARPHPRPADAGACSPLCRTTSARASRS